MLNVKLVVLFLLLLVPILTYASYCEICLNHTLCQYPVSFIIMFIYDATLITDEPPRNSLESLDGILRK